MVKKLSVPLVILIVVLTFLTACGNSPTTPTPAAQTTQPVVNPSTMPPSTTTSIKPTTLAATSATTIAPQTTTTAPPASPTPKYGGIFKFADPRAPSTTIGWLAETGASGGMWTYPMLETLMECDINNQFSPMLATQWVVADDLKSITFTLRQGVKFHDGSDFNAAVAKWNIDNMIAAKLSVNYTFMTAVEALDDHTLKITVSKYNNEMLNTLASVYMVSKVAFDAKGKEGLRWNPVGTGPFKFVSFQRDVAIKYTKFADYWQKGKPYLDGLEMYFGADPVTMSAAFKAGDYDAMGGDLSSVFYDLQQSSYPIVKCYAGTYVLAPDSKNVDSPWNKLKVRQALDYAIDRDALVKARGFGYWQTLYQYANPGTPSYNNNLGNRAYDPVKAKQLLAEAGYAGGFQTKIYADVASSDKDAITAIQAYMQAVNIKADLSILDFASYGNYRTKGWNNAVLAGMVGFFANPNQGTDFYWAKTAFYFPSIDKSDDLQNLHLASLATKEFDPAAYQKLTQYEFDNALMLPLWAGSRGDAIKPFVKDSAFYTLSAWTGWKPYQTWLDK
jgi:ABC-type transport system substrate-binding protein